MVAKKERIAQQITLDSATWQAIDKAASKMKLTRSIYIEQVMLGTFKPPGAK